MTLYAPRDRLHMLLEDYVQGALSTADFCGQFETIFNLELDKTTVPGAELAALQRLFDDVVWYSDVREDRAQYPGYLDENAIKRAALDAWRLIQETKR